MLRALASIVLLGAAWAHPAQAPFGHASTEEYPGAHTPRIHYNTIPEHAGFADPPRSMRIQPIHTSGPSAERVDLTFFSDGYTNKEEKKFIHDARVLADELVSDNGAMAHVKDLLNIWAVFSPSKHSGVGVHDTPLEGNPFGLYRPGPELRGVYVKHPKVARAACRHWRDSKHGGCDSAILLGNDPLYGGLGGEFTVITSSDKNGPLILRHELGHTLIPVGDEYDGEAGYCGVNAERVGKLQDIKWKKYLTKPDQLRVEDAQVRLQAYPWHDLSESAYEVRFFGSNPVNLTSARLYPSAHLRVSLSSIPHPSHINLTLNGQRVDLSPAFEESWTGSKDRRWVDLDLPRGIAGGSVHLRAELTSEGRTEPAGQGGKMITSVEIMEYGTPDRFNGTAGYIGAFPVFGKDGKVTLRPTNEDCLMRKTTQPGFCPVCKDELRASLQRMVAAKSSGHSVAEGWDCKL